MDATTAKLVQDSFAKVAPAARAVAIRHDDYGAKPQHYCAPGAWLIRTQEEGLDRDFTPRVRTAWIEFCVLLARVVVGAAYGPEWDKEKVQ